MKKFGLLVLPLFVAALMLSGCGDVKAPGTLEEVKKVEACTCSKDCKMCAKDMKNCGKEGCTCMAAKDAKAPVAPEKAAPAKVAPKAPVAAPAKAAVKK